jgi:signal transduction histidine kinase
MRITNRYCTILLMACFLYTKHVLSQAKVSELYKKSYEQFKTGKYDDALITNIQALKLAEASKNCDEIAYAYLQVGKMQYYNKERRQALSYFFKSKELADSCHIDSIQHIIYHNIGAMYVELRVIDSALLHLKKAKDILELTAKYADLSKVNGVIADLYLFKKPLPEYEEAEKYILEAERFAEKSQDNTWIAFAKMKRGILYERSKKYESALQSFNDALQLYSKIGAIEGKIYAMRNILDIKLAINSPDVRKYVARFQELKDSVYRAEGANKIAEYKTIYETEKKEQINKLLQQENNLKQAQLETRNRTITMLVFAIVLIVVIIVWRINAGKLKKRQLELEATQKVQKEKERISRDLHDNVGGQLSYILYSLDALDDTDSNANSELKENINQSVRGVIQNLRETIWAINDEQLTASDLSDKLKVYARGMFKHTPVKVVFKEKMEKQVAFNSLVGLNLYRICQEVLNNAFKYAKASEISINIRSGEKTTITITDNGVGFDVDTHAEGFGLNNIKARATEIGASVSFHSEKNKGVTVTIVV